MHGCRCGVLALAVFFVFCAVSRADIIDFEGLPDGEAITTQFPGLTFSNSITLTSGVSLNEFELPPHSGVAVASDLGGPITIDFANPILSFGAYFTYAAPLTLTAFDATEAPVAAAMSMFSNNMALSGDLGSSPNEFIGVSSVAGISRITIAGDSGGSSFALDDAQYTEAASPVPEPTSLILSITGLSLAALFRRRITSSHPKP